MAFLLEDPIALENAGQAGPCDWLGALRILASQKISGNNNYPPLFCGGVGGWVRGFFCCCFLFLQILNVICIFVYIYLICIHTVLHDVLG